MQKNEKVVCQYLQFFLTELNNLLGLEKKWVSDSRHLYLRAHYILCLFSYIYYQYSKSR